MVGSQPLPDGVSALLYEAADHINELRAAKTWPDWQPIESAPKDGTTILAWDGDLQAVVRWCSCKQEWLVLRADDNDGEAIFWEKLTHWLPLPPRPTTTEEPKT